MFDPDRFISARARAIDASGIRRVFDLGAKLRDPINLSIGQPDFDVPDSIKNVAVAAIRAGHNRYTVTQGLRQLQEKVTTMVGGELPAWQSAFATGTQATLITSGVSGGLLLAVLACVGPGDEVILADPAFVMYRHLITLAGATPVFVDTYPDFQLTAARVAPHITARTKLLLCNSPANPTGVVATDAICRELAELARQHNILLLSDEIYNEFCFAKTLRPGDTQPHCPSPAACSTDMLLLRGFSKTYAMTGWRLGWAAGPKPIIDQMTKLQQYSFVCAPSMAQFAGVTALDFDPAELIEQYRRKRDRTVEKLSSKYALVVPEGAFYAFPEVPPRLGLTGSQFVDRAIARNLLIIPGSVFSRRDTHFRLSYACNDKMLDRGLDLLLELGDD